MARIVDSSRLSSAAGSGYASARKDGSMRSGKAMAEQCGGSLAGYWTGVFSYDYADDAPTPFNAVLTQRGERLTGEIIEPNTFADAAEHELFSSLVGVAHGADVAFVKTYEPLPGAGHKIAYRGSVDATATRIEGEWRQEARWTGRFVMNRVAEAAEQAAGGAEAALLDAQGQTR